MAFKKEIGEGAKKIRENSEKTVELGKKMQKQAEQTGALTRSIELQSRDDMRAMEQMRAGLQKSYDGAFGKEVGDVGKTIEKQGGELSRTVGGELKNVRAGIGKLEKAEEVSEVGKSAIENGRAKLENSAGNYEEIRSDVEDTVDQTRAKIEKLHKNLDAVFNS